MRFLDFLAKSDWSQNPLHPLQKTHCTHFHKFLARECPALFVSFTRSNVGCRPLLSKLAPVEHANAMGNFSLFAPMPYAKLNEFFGVVEQMRSGFFP